MNNNCIVFIFIAYDKLRDSASNASNGVKRRKKFVFFLII